VYAVGVSLGYGSSRPTKHSEPTAFRIVERVPSTLRLDLFKRALSHLTVARRRYRTLSTRISDANRPVDRFVRANANVENRDRASTRSL